MEATNPGHTTADAALASRLAEIDRITREPNAPLRNLLITQSYHELAEAIAAVIGNGNANWSSFATWASKTAGQSIRGEEVPNEVAGVLRADAAIEPLLAAFTKPFPLLGWLKMNFDVFDVARAVVKEVSVQIAAGNLKVFAELAPLFARFAHAFAEPSRRQAPVLAAFVAGLAPGPADRGGQDSLKLAFTSYVAAANAATTKERAELTLYGNVLIGLHEQTRLQEHIQGGIDAPLAPEVYRSLQSGTVWRLPILSWLFGRRLRQLRAGLREIWERIATRHFMRLALPNGGSMSLGADIVVAGRPFPADLDPLHHPELIALIKAYDSHLDTLKGSGARNWTDLRNRMAFIADLFRSQQCDPTLFTPPFEPDQVAAMRAGRMPTGAL
jgi:hypothetical protein